MYRYFRPHSFCYLYNCWASRNRFMSIWFLLRILIFIFAARSRCSNASLSGSDSAFPPLLPCCALCT